MVARKVATMADQLAALKAVPMGVQMAGDLAYQTVVSLAVPMAASTAA